MSESKFRNGYTVTLADGTTTEYSRKDRAVKAGEESGQAFIVLSAKGLLVHTHPAATPAPAEAEQASAQKPRKAPAKAKVPTESPAVTKPVAERSGKAVTYTGSKVLFAPFRDAVENLISKEDGFTVSAANATDAKTIEDLWNTTYAEFRRWKKGDVDRRRTLRETADGKREILTIELAYLTDRLGSI